TANALYQRLMTVGLGEQALKEISQTAITELGITLIDETQLKRLKEKVNPRRYMKPYNAEKVSLANELFARISKGDFYFLPFFANPPDLPKSAMQYPSDSHCKITNLFWNIHYFLS
ncbi:MAG: hypothetical protein J5641_03220, partial [Bacteroidales bacterium]|nr:hypothetical protein [Bacteroidales bacterium]